MSDLTPLSSQSAGLLPTPCGDCVFWQHDRMVSDAGRKETWCEAFESRHGSFGLILRDGDRFLGMIQYGPSGAFPRALSLPGGPPARDAGLVTCTFLVEAADPGGVCERLLLEALADMKSRNTRAVEAFALRYPEEVPSEDRLLGHHTLFDRDLLESLGFTRKRTRGQVSLMRLELGGIVATPGLIVRAARLVRPTPQPGQDPAPA